MRRVRCTLPPGGDITVHAGDRTRAFHRHDLADLDERIAPGLSLEAALGPHVVLFEPFTEDPSPAADPGAVDDADHQE